MNMQIVRFGDLYAIPSGNGLSRPTAVRGEGYRMIGMGELFANDIINDIEMDRVQMSDREKQSFFVEPDDLLFARQSLVAAGAGKCSIVKELKEPTTYESHLIRVRLDKNKCNPWYYYYLFKLPDNPIKAIVNQCAQAGIRGNELVKIKVPLHPRPCQDRIVSVLSTYDNLIEVNNKRIKVLEQMAENLYKEWFVRFRFPGHENTKFNNGIPIEWTIKRLGEYGRVETGKTPSMEVEEYYGDDYLFIKTPEMHGNVFVIDTEEKLSELGHKSQSKKLLPPNSIMVTCIGTGGVVALNAKPGHTNQQINSIILKDMVYLEWLFFTCKSMKSTIEMFGATGSTMTNLSKGKFEKLKVIEPTRDLIEQYHTITNPVLEEIKRLTLVNESIIRQRDLLLPRLMSGKLEV